MLGLKFRVDCLYFTTFREPTSTSLILSYVVPPYTTLRGMISNALGLLRDDLRVQEWFKIGIKPLGFEKCREMAKIVKLVSREIAYKCENCNRKFISKKTEKKCKFCKSVDIHRIQLYKRTFSSQLSSASPSSDPLSSPMFREFLVEPSYEIFLVGDEDKIKEVHSALLNPKRPLYLGGSDDLVDVEVFEPVEVEEVEAEEVWSVVEGVYEDCIVEKVPYKFVKVGRTFGVEYKVVSIPIKPIHEKIGCIKIYNECVVVM
jgi:CRISPR-associated protein Cas5h